MYAAEVDSCKRGWRKSFQVRSSGDREGSQGSSPGRRLASGVARKSSSYVLPSCHLSERAMPYKIGLLFFSSSSAKIIKRSGISYMLESPTSNLKSSRDHKGSNAVITCWLDLLKVGKLDSDFVIFKILPQTSPRGTRLSAQTKKSGSPKA